MRLREERLVIHDRRRNLATFCYQGKVYEAKIEREIPDPTEFERSISKLWLKYFETVGIKERRIESFRGRRFLLNTEVQSSNLIDLLRRRSEMARFITDFDLYLIGEEIILESMKNLAPIQ